MFFRPFFAAIAVAAVIGSAAGAQAATEQSAIAQSVFVGDLNLSNEAGTRVALQRIEVAASAVCGDQPDLRLLDRAAHYHACVRAAVDRAVVSLDHLMAGLHAPHGAGVLASER